jgi:hypothetical protein
MGITLREGVLSPQTPLVPDDLMRRILDRVPVPPTNSEKFQEEWNKFRRRPTFPRLPQHLINAMPNDNTDDDLDLDSDFDWLFDDEYTDNDNTGNDNTNNEWDWDDYGYVWRRVLIPFDDDMHPTRFSWRWFWRSWGWHYINNNDDDGFYGPPSDDEDYPRYQQTPPTPRTPPAPQTPPAPRTPPAPQTPPARARPETVISSQFASRPVSEFVAAGVLVRRPTSMSRYAPRRNNNNDDDNRRVRRRLQ